jgi:DNA-binding LytR/AlgR family response regulator
MTHKCLIIDDEPLAIEVIATHMKQIPDLEVIATFQNPLKAFQFLQNESIDLIFLDIEMPLITGIDFVKNLENPPKVIFTTAHRDYAVTSYELDVVDYLLKPISFSRLFKAINKYKSLLKTSEEVTSQNQEITANDHIYVNSNKKYIKIAFDDILYVESLKDYVRIHLSDQKVMTKDTIGNFLKKLPSQFLRIHRSFLINTTKVTAFTSMDVEIGTKEIPIGASYKNDTIQFFKD